MTGKIILAADGMLLGACVDLVSKIGNRLHAVKIHNLYDAWSKMAVDELRQAGARKVWVDLKLHDIPETVKSRATALCYAGADIITVHASGGVDMMKAAMEGAKSAEVYAVTLLTSLSPGQASAIYGAMVPEEIVTTLAWLAKEAGVAGLVCSSKEVGLLSSIPELKGMKFIVPGSRSPGKDTHDQQRVDTPAAAVRGGATYLVVGRQITQAKDPVIALAEIELEIAGVA